MTVIYSGLLSLPAMESYMTSKVDALLTSPTNQESSGKFNLVLTFSLMDTPPRKITLTIKYLPPF